MKKNLLLVQPIASYTNTQPVLPQDAVGIGMLTILAYVSKFGYSGEVVHLPIAFSSGYQMEDILRHIKETDPDVIGIGLNWLHFSDGALETAKILRTIFPDKVIVIGGQHATLFAQEIVEKSPELTAVTIGESERTYMHLLNAVNTGTDVYQTPGLGYLNHGIYYHSNPEIIENLDEIPFYTYTCVWPKNTTICAAVDTVRGTCPKNCSYCIESKTNTLQGRRAFSHHSPKYIAGQIESFYKEGIHSVTIQDPITLLGESFLTELCHEILNKDMKLDILNIFVEPHFFSADFFHLLSQCAKLVSLDYGIESGSERVLAMSGRSFPRQKLLSNFELASKLGIRLLTWWMVGMPGETPESVAETFHFMQETIKVGALPRWVTPLILFPQTDMANNADSYGISTIFRDFSDYAKFSQVQANKYGVYEPLITHTPEALSTKEIVENTIALKKGIQKLLNDNLDVLVGFGWEKEAVISIAEEVGGSFF